MLKKTTTYLTCGLCHHFDGNREVCTIHNRDTFSVNQRFAEDCKEEGTFMRELTVLYGISNFYKDGETIPSAYMDDFNNLPKDKNGLPIYVITKRGNEKAIPAYEGLELVSDLLQGVKREFTYQGQRELIYELGESLARKRCKALGVNLVVLPHEKGAEGLQQYKNYERIYHADYGELDYE